MRVLIAEDDASSCKMLQLLLSKWGYDVTVAHDGEEAWKILCQPDHPQLVILDWMMPGIEGPEIVRRLRERASERPYYSIIITSRSNKDSAARALNSGADDFIGKPFDNDELRARVAVGYRTNCLQTSLSEHVSDLRQALDRVKQLEGIIPICAYCKKIRDDHNDWNQLEKYITNHSEAKFSHGICPKCAEEQMKLFAELKRSEG
ncbi:MAG TPA: response regulator transcription factor [Desulfuromonadales bacterium]|nr:response regulator transcription factor [Desulfuromonadales bacterium]